LTFAEQGAGDVIQFCRYGRLSKGLGAEVVMEVPAPLVNLVRTLGSQITVISQGEPPGHVDVHCPMMSLPLALLAVSADIPCDIPYLRAEAMRLAAVHASLGAKTKPRVGLVWSGARAHPNDRNRSVPVARLAPLLNVAVEFHALHTEFRQGDLECLRHLPQVILHPSELVDFSDTAAWIMAMDLLICVDTSVAHLAGALGAPVWILLPFAPDFRWQLNRSDSPWYPTATLLRQPAPGDWDSVIDIAATRLRRWAGS